MEALAARIAAFCLQKHYIKPDQIAWLQYGLMRRLMGMVTFLLPRSNEGQHYLLVLILKLK